MALGLLTGSETPKDAVAKERASRLAREFIEEFRLLKDAVNCNALTGLDISTAEGHQQMGERKTKQNVCIPLMRETMVLMNEFATKEGLIK